MTAVAAEIAAAGSETELTVVRDLFAAERGYATPKLDVRGVVFRDGRILLVRERVERAWTLDRDRHGHEPPVLWRTYKLFFRCELRDVERSPASNVETDAAEWFREDALPELSRGRVTEAQTARAFEHLRDPSLPTDFD